MIEPYNDSKKVCAVINDHWLRLESSQCRIDWLVAAVSYRLKQRGNMPLLATQFDNLIVKDRNRIGTYVAWIGRECQLSTGTTLLERCGGDRGGEKKETVPVTAWQKRQAVKEIHNRANGRMQLERPAKISSCYGLATCLPATDGEGARRRRLLWSSTSRRSWTTTHPLQPWSHLPERNHLSE